jgi:hypothetical protein
MDAREFAEWIAYARIQPFGELRDDQRAGAIASAIVNTHIKKNAKPFTWRSFFPTYDDRNPSNTWQDLLSKVIGFNRNLGGKDERKTPADDY